MQFELYLFYISCH